MLLPLVESSKRIAKMLRYATVTVSPGGDATTVLSATPFKLPDAGIAGFVVSAGNSHGGLLPFA